ncbi:MAG: hypothetical protein HY840_12070 [Bacteroidetes bacterium]|nr:hypothetical protein [Bacteroidota bacterium]
MKIFAKEKKLQYEFEIDSVINKVNYKSNKIYTIAIYVNAKWGMKKYSSGQNIVAISNDCGKNWKFFAIDDRETALGILKMKFPQNIIDKVLARM